MKISPIPTSGAGSTAIAEEGHSAGADRVARAKAVLAGQNPDAPPPRQDAQDRHLAAVQASIKRIKMRVNHTPTEPQTPVETVAPEATGSAIPDGSATTAAPEAAAPATEATKPISPQFAALMKQQRALQVRERQIADRERAITEKETGTTPAPDLLARLKTDPLSVLDEQGVTYDQLTEAILARSQEQGPGYQRIQAELRALKEGLENQTKAVSDRDLAARAQVLSQMRKDADALVTTSGDTFELVKEAGLSHKAVELVERTFDKTGEILDVEEALGMIEAQLLEDHLKFSKAKKLQQTQAPAQQPAGAKAPQQTPPIRTLTNRDGSRVPMSRRDRALLAFRGELK